MSGKVSILPIGYKNCWLQGIVVWRGPHFQPRACIWWASATNPIGVCRRAKIRFCRKQVICNKGRFATMKTRIKICGLTRLEDLQFAVDAGADAIGLVFYPPSPRFIDLESAAELARSLPPFVSLVGPFVNAEPAIVNETLAAVPLHLLQFHGEEDERYCRQFNRP